MNLIIANIPAMICYGIGGYLAIHGQEGWGWFLFVGLLCTQVAK